MNRREFLQCAAILAWGASASQLGTSPSGITRIALPSAKNNVAMITTPAPRTGCDGLRTAATIAPSVEVEITANITQCPARSGPLTLPGQIALARMPCFAYSAAIERVSPCTPPFEAE